MSTSFTSPELTVQRTGRSEPSAITSVGPMANSSATTVDGRQLADWIRRTVAERLCDAVRANAALGAPSLDPRRRVWLIHRFLDDAVAQFAAGNLSVSADPSRVNQRAVARSARAATEWLLGFAGLQPLLRDPGIEEIKAYGADVVFASLADGTVARVAAIADSDTELIELINHVAARTGPDDRRFDVHSPVLRMRLADGSRLHAVMGASERPCVTIRRHRLPNATMQDLTALGMLSPAVADLLTAAMRDRMDIAISGGRASGRTTLAGALARSAPPEDYLVTVEDPYEWVWPDNVVGPHVVALQVSGQYADEIGVHDTAGLVRLARRMSPDRIVVSDVHDLRLLGEVFSGPGSVLATLQANSSAAAVNALTRHLRPTPACLALATVEPCQVPGPDLVVHLGRARDRRRIVTSVREVVTADDGRRRSIEILRAGEDGVARSHDTPTAHLLAGLEAHGFTPDRLRHSGRP